MTTTTAACLDDNDVARFVGEPATSAWRAKRELHLDVCGGCRTRVALAMIDLSAATVDQDNEPPDPRRAPAAARRFRWSEGDELAGYVLTEEIGRGGMGIVFAARHRTRGVEHALKLTVEPTPKHTRRLIEREAHAARLFADGNVPALVPILDILEGVDEAPVLVMPRLRGQSLAARLMLQKPPLPDETNRIVTALLETLAAIHHAGAVHRDIKPANLFLEDSGAIRLLDFGLVWLEQQQPNLTTTTSRTMGTPRYLAPEMAHANKNSPPDPRTDLWGVGHVAFELVTGGAHVLHGHRLGEILRELAKSTKLPRADERSPNVPRAIADVIAMLLEKDPAARPTTATEALDLWKRAVQSQTAF